MLPAAQVLMAADCPPKATVPALPPRFVPLIMTTVPAAPLFGARLLIAGVSTVNATPLLCNPPIASTTFPLVAPLGTTAVTLVLVQFDVEADRPLKVTVPVVPVKLLPAIEMEAPGSPLAGVRLVIVGATATVKFTPLLATPPAAVTTTLPETAPEGTTTVMLLLVQPVIDVTGMLPNFTALPVPWALKFDPAIVTEDPTSPELG